MYIDKLYLEVTRVCNLKCEHCFRGESKNEFMSTQTINNIFENIKEIETLLLTGGEPLLAIEQIENIIRIIKDKNIKVDNITLVTNGTILNKRIIEALRELSNISLLKIEISYDMFHYLELKRLGLLDRRQKNAQILKELFNAEDYGNFKDTSRKKKLYWALGRALNLSKERLEEINNMSESKYILEENTYTFYNEWVEYDEGKCYIGRVINIDVNGNVIHEGSSYDVEDSEKDKYHSNINEIGLLQSILNYIEYQDYLLEHKELILKPKKI